MTGKKLGDFEGFLSNSAEFSSCSQTLIYQQDLLLVSDKDNKILCVRAIFTSHTKLSTDSGRFLHLFGIFCQDKKFQNIRAMFTPQERFSTDFGYFMTIVWYFLSDHINKSLTTGNETQTQETK